MNHFRNCPKCDSCDTRVFPVPNGFQAVCQICSYRAQVGRNDQEAVWFWNNLFAAPATGAGGPPDRSKEQAEQQMMDDHDLTNQSAMDADAIQAKWESRR